MSVQELMNLRNSSDFTFEKKFKFKQGGRPMPALTLIQTTKDKGKDVNRYFKPSMYDICDWICGCDTSNAFFCFPCLIFCGESLWTKTGVKDIKHLKESIKKHSESAGHINSSLSFASLGRVDIRIQLDSANRTSLREFNEQVSKNRCMLNTLIDSVKFCGILELAHNETETLQNSGVFSGPINIASELDVVFKNHVENSSAFKEISETIQSELLDSMLVVIHKAIIDEIERANVLAIIAEESTGASKKTQMLFLVRYVLNGKIHERFWKLVNGTTAEDPTNVILGELAILGIDKTPEKLIAQSYDGAAVMRGKLGGVQCKVKQTYPDANFVHYYAHQLNLILQKIAVSQHRQIKIFFANLHAFSSFFSKSPKRIAVLDRFVEVRTSQDAPTSWHDIECVEIVHTYKTDLIKCLEAIVNTEQDDDDISQASVLLTYLRDENFEFWLNFFHLIVSHVDVVFNKLQIRGIDAISVKGILLDFKDNIRKAQNDILDQSIPIICSVASTSKKRKWDEDNSYTKYNIANKVCDIILSEIAQRFAYTDHLIIVQLFQAENFPAYRETFPEYIVKVVKKTYHKINISKLKSELEVIYSREDFQNSAGALAILQLFINMDLMQTFSESVKLLEIICTIPMTTVESERCFSTLKRVKTFLRNTTSQSRFTSFAMLSIERSFVLSIEKFNEQVIEHFANQKERRLDLKFKQV